ncbi:MAG: Maf family protein [Gemmatimonadota bacterium]
MTPPETIPALVLASASPRRTELLARIGLPHRVDPAHVDESVRPGEPAIAYVRRLAEAKARAVADRHPGAVVVAADTTVILDGEILGKPADAADARAMLERLAGRSHVVATAVAVARGDRVVAAVDEATVHMRAAGPEASAAYVATGEPLDKAGAYGIQGFGGTLVDGIAGDYHAVMGLGLATTVRLLGEVGLAYHFAAGLRER